MDNKTKAKQFIKRAKSNLIRGKETSYLDLKEIAIEDLCFDLQQSAEKSLKAVLTFYGIDYPFSHKLNILIDLLEENSVEIPEFVKDSVILNAFAVEARYDDVLHLTEDVHKESVEITENVYNWAEIIVNEK
ncbi:MAG: HEPN domain-containing protein [bacterium]